MCCSVLQCVPACCSVLQRVAACCSVLHRQETCKGTVPPAGCCIVLQHVAVFVAEILSVVVFRPPHC